MRLRELIISNSLLQGLKVLNREICSISMADRDKDPFYQPFGDDRPLKLETVGGVMNREMDFHGCGVIHIMRGDDGDRDVCLDENTHEIHLLFDREELDFVL